ncbi:MAG TPA: neuroendocrine convertase 1, partial [Thermoanaerobaculia bacterium]
MQNPRPSRAPRAILAMILALSCCAAAAAQPPTPLAIAPSAIAQMQALAQEKKARTPAQKKIDSHLRFATLKLRGDALLAAVPHLRVPAADADGKVLVEIGVRTVGGMKGVLNSLTKVQGEVRHASFRSRTITARVPLAQVEALAASDAVRQISLARKPHLGKVNTSEGDITHRAAEARSFFGVDGTGVKICVLSDGVDSLATVAATGDVPADVDVLPGQAGAGDEGTAMLEIVHDLAPGAKLGFATILFDPATFAQNIRDLRNVAKCDIVVDDATYFQESPFQDNDV